MSTRPSLRVTSAASSATYHLLIVALGYEARSSHVASMLYARADRLVALAFDSSGALSFGSNQAVLDSLGADLQAIAGDIGAQISALIDECPNQSVRVGIDISSMTRLQIAQTIEALTLANNKELVDVDFLYSPARSANWEVPSGPIRIAEPIHPAFAAWGDDPSTPLTAIFGVGVEENLALGIAEFLDVSSVFAFVPVGGDQEFEQLNEAANADFLQSDYISSKSEYDISRPFELFTRLESLIYGLSVNARIAIVPLGPKIFALSALLATIASEGTATVWRFSSSVGAEPVERIAAGPILTLKVILAATS